MNLDSVFQLHQFTHCGAQILTEATLETRNIRESKEKTTERKSKEMMV